MSKEPAPILASDPFRRLDAIIRRHGGKPAAITSVKGKVILPAIGQRECEDQLSFDDALTDGEDDSTVTGPTREPT